ncbi:HAD hydrolase-like protein [Mucilaginibacter sp. Bleaf8]|uniref:HAD family hydrolase n=1 Tax=Mucilaginibacter sp. Bleaf8 TaxID=2834430 RepID=UPI001BCBBD1F|nr:HAD family hydrolase [Mucilaginibacter sp. Bleaf8]MBS7563705.1 HAD hydrolase-like protein [Mucilaginibacter sp. Bleaf8]
MIKALILDLDNTIYPVESISDELFVPLYDLMEQYRDEVGEDTLQEAKQEMMKVAFQKVADKHQFPEELKKKGVALLSDLTYEGNMTPFEDYSELQNLATDKHLVTMGFTKMQWRKVDKLNLRPDFIEIVVNDPETTEGTKKEVFQDIMQKHNYQPNEVLVIGDDPNSEIKAGKDLGMITVLYDRKGEYGTDQSDYKIASFTELKSLPLEIS